MVDTVKGSRQFEQGQHCQVAGVQCQVAALASYTESGFQQNLKTGAVFLDLTAAYDTIWHTGLLFKLSKSMPYWFTRLVNLRS